MAIIQVTFETISDESASNGDFADHGFIHPETEERHSCATERALTLREAREGVFQWPSIRAALAYCRAQAGDRERPVGQVDERPVGQVDDRVSATFYGTYDPDQTDEMQVNVTLFVEGVSDGTLARLSRVLEGRGVYFG